MTWTDLIDRLLTIQKANSYPPQWVVDQIEAAGNPPKQIWRTIAQKLGFTKFWADWKWLPGQETEEPDLMAIDWERYPPAEPTAKPVLKCKPVSAIPRA
jgi:hypothetical protein